MSPKTNLCSVQSPGLINIAGLIPDLARSKANISSTITWKGALRGSKVGSEAQKKSFNCGCSKLAELLKIL